MDSLLYSNLQGQFLKKHYTKSGITVTGGKNSYITIAVEPAPKGYSMFVVNASTTKADVGAVVSAITDEKIHVVITPLTSGEITIGLSIEYIKSLTN